jgi:branched-chain amino acid transport system permease protein
MQWLAFILAGGVAGLAGALYAFSKGSISPESLSVGKSVDGLVMVLLGGIQTLAGPVVGAFSFTWLHDVVARNTDYWRAMLGAIILILVLLFPQGIAGSVQGLWERLRSRFSATSSTAGGASS